VGVPLSVTRTVKFEVPTVVGVPLIPPAALSVSPAGKLPDAIAHVLFPVPPLDASVWLYAVPTTAGGNDEVVTVSVGGLTTMLNAL
jgi:hypothetical protein